MSPTRSRRQVTVADDRPLARAVGARIRRARAARGLSQREVAGDRYTSSYISALENGLVKPSVAALSYLAERLRVPMTELLSDERREFGRLEADLRLASGDWEEAASLYRQLLDAPPDERAQAEAQRGLAEALARQGRSVEAAGAASKAVELFAALGRKEDAAQATYWLAFAAYQQESVTEARSLLQGILEAARSGVALPADLRVRTLIALANAENWEGAHEQAAIYLEEAHALVGELDERRQAAFLMSLAVSYRDSGDLEGALRSGERSLALFKSAEAAREVAILNNSLALTYLQLGSLERARAYADSAATSIDELHDPRLMTHLHDTRAQIALAAGDLDAAITGADAAVASAREQSNQHALLDGLLTRARIHLRAARAEEAERDYSRAVELVRDHGSAARRRRVLSEWADVLRSHGDLERATNLFREALELK